MAQKIKRGEVWQYSFKHSDKRRPVVVISRAEVIDLLDTVMVAPITSNIHGAPSEVIVGIDEGLKHESAINLDHVQTIEKARLTGFIGTLSPEKMHAVCRALVVATGCESLPLRPKI